MAAGKKKEQDAIKKVEVASGDALNYEYCIWLTGTEAKELMKLGLGDRIRRVEVKDGLEERVEKLEVAIKIVEMAMRTDPLNRIRSALEPIEKPKT